MAIFPFKSSKENSDQPVARSKQINIQQENQKLPCYSKSSQSIPVNSTVTRSVPQGIMDKPQQVAWTGSTIGIDPQYVRTDPITLGFRKDSLSKDTCAFAIDKTTNQPLFALHPISATDKVNQIKIRLNNKKQSEDSIDGTTNALQHATHIITDLRTNTKVLYLAPFVQGGIINEFISLRQYEAFVPDQSTPIFEVTYPTKVGPSRLPNPDPEKTKGTKNPNLNLNFINQVGTQEKIQIQLTHAEIPQARWAMNVLPSKNWIAEVWPKEESRFRIPFKGKNDTWTMKVGPKVDLLLVATIALAKIVSDQQILDHTRAQAVVMLGA